MRKIKQSGDEQAAYKDAKFRVKDLKNLIQQVARFAKAISEMIDLLGNENVWQVHNMDLVDNSKVTMMEMYDFFNVYIYCSDDYTYRLVWTRYIQECFQDKRASSLATNRKTISDR